MSELLPCPFCGGTDIRVFDNRLVCNSCSATGPDLGHCVGAKCRADAIAAWNHRAPVPLPVDAPEPTPGQIDRTSVFAPSGHKREFVLLASYCGGDDPLCTPQQPCHECLQMCNVFGPDGTYLRQFGANTPGQIDLLCLSVIDVLDGRLETGDAAADLAAVKEHLDTALKLTGFDGGKVE